MKLAVLIPTYKSEVHFEKIIKNLKKIKNEKDIRFLIRDDTGSYSESFEKLKKIFPKASFCKNRENIGECTTTNLLFQQARHEGITHALLLHQDDIYISGWISDGIKFLKKNKNNKTFALFGKYKNGTEKKKPDNKKQKSSWIKKPQGILGIKYLGIDWYWQISGAILPVPVWCGAGGMNPVLRYCGDNEIAVKMLECGAIPFCGNKYSLLKENKNNTSAKVFTATDAAIGWAYLMAKYLKYRTNTETTVNILKCLRTYYSKKYLFSNKLQVTVSSTCILFRAILYSFLMVPSVLDFRVRRAFLKK